MSVFRRFQKNISMQTMVLDLVVLVVSLLLLIVAIIFLTGRNVVDRYMADMGSATVLHYRSQLDDAMESLESYCTYSIGSSGIVSAMQQTQDPLERQSCTEKIGSLLSFLMQEYPDIQYVLCVSNTDRTAYVQRSACSSMAQSGALHRAVLDIFDYDSPTGNRRWSWRQIEGSTYLTGIFRLSDSDCAVLLRPSILSRINDHNELLPFVCVDESRYYAGNTQLQEQLDHQPTGVERLRLDGIRYRLDRLPSEKGTFSVGALVNLSKPGLRTNLYLSGLLLLALTVTVCLCFYVALRYVMNCFRSLDQAFRTVAEGDLTTRIDRRSFTTEEAHVYAAFNNMTDKIDTLQKDLIEQERSVQRSKMRFLRIQIKSHFFNNCLNTIYSLACVRNTELIQEFAMCLSDYFRYLGTGFSDTVSLGSELSHLQNYVKIHQLRYPDRVFYTCTLDPELEDFRILPLVLQTFVENVFRHALVDTQQVHIRVQVEASGAGIRIRICDDGAGFPPEALSELNAPVDDPYVRSGRGVGIRNTKVRLAFYYGGCADIHFENLEPHGAAICITLPEIPEKE